MTLEAWRITGNLKQIRTDGAAPCGVGGLRRLGSGPTDAPGSAVPADAAVGVAATQLLRIAGALSVRWCPCQLRTDANCPSCSLRRGQLCEGRLGTPLGLALKIAPHDAGVGCGAAGAFRIGGNEHSTACHRWRRMENICLSCKERHGLRTQSTRWAGSARSWAPPVEALGAARGRRKSRAMRLLSETRLGAACCGAEPRGRAARRVRATGLSSNETE